LFVDKNNTKDRVMISIDQEMAGFKSFVEEVRQGVGQWVERRLEARLEAEVEAWLHGRPYARRAGVGPHQINRQCCRCGTREVSHFSRNGHRRRQLVTTFGVLTIWLPRVVCTCGGSVPIPYSVLRPYQRLWEDVLEHIGRWATLGLSLRQMQTEIGEQLQTQIGLRKLNETVQQVRQPVELTLSRVPPVILLDAIWLTLLEDAATHRPDRLGRQRKHKQREKVCLLVALGLYPQTGRWGVLAWALADSESQAAWERLLMPLEARGVYRERGLELLIHDGGAGLVAALNLMYPHIPHQRCLFHKLRNLWHAIHPPATLSRDAAHAFKRDLLQQVRAIFYATTADQAQQLRDAFCLHWQTHQPEWVATLCRDWPDSMAFFRVSARFPTWSPRFLRTTSLLERLNRTLRRLFRAASAFHSPGGVLAVVARLLNPLRLI
jgi:transposase-like protein